jgi:predicted RND superfamily exporter protein
MWRPHVSRSLDLAFERLARAQIARPWLFVLMTLAVTIASGLLSSRLQLRTRFDQLLPEDRPSVVELKRLQDNVPAGSHVFVVIEGGDVTAQRSLGDELVSHLRGLGAPWLIDVADGVHEARAFLGPRAGLFAKLEDLQKLRDDVEARWDWEIGKRTGTNLVDDEEPPALSWDDIRKRFDAPAAEQFPDGYYQANGGRALVVVANTSIATGDLAGARDALNRIRQATEEVHRQERHRQLRVSFAGDLVTGLAEFSAVQNDLMSVGILGVSLVLAVIFLFFMRLRAIAALGVAMAAGLASTFGLTYLVIGHLNLATGFLVSIVAGNGINFGIIYMARFFEERTRGLAAPDAILVAHRTTWPSTLTAAVAAAASYGSLCVSEFRAFRHFALIGAAGMLLCWLATYAVVAPILVVIERRAPWINSSHRKESWLSRYRRGTAPYGAPFAWLVSRAAAPLAIGGVGLAVIGTVALVPYLRSDPMEYNMRRMQNDLGDSAEMYRVSTLAADVLGANIDSSMVLLADRVEQIPRLQRVLEERRDSALPSAKPFEAVHTIFDFVPDRQSEKIPVLEQIRTRVVRARERGLISEDQWSQLKPWLPPQHLEPWGASDLPEALARPFTDKSGIRGRLALIEPTAGKNDSDLKYLIRWADSFREVDLAGEGDHVEKTAMSERIRGSGRAVIFADMLKTVMHDIPPSVVLSLGLTIVAVVLTFRRGVTSLAVVGALAIGLGWVALAVAAMQLKINFFNFIALPISFGIGVDYAVNLVQRKVVEPSTGIVEVLRTTGGAIVLCSLTTTLGYLALVGSINQAIRSLGVLAAIGEVGCLLAAVVVLPAILLWQERGLSTPIPGTRADEEPAR